MRLLAALVLSLGLGCGASARAEPAKAQPPPEEPVMQVNLVRSAAPGCGRQCPEWIAAQGRIEPGTAARFKTVLRRLGKRKVPVLIDSGGGSVSESFEIGRMLRARGLDVVVAGTVLAPCGRTDSACRQGRSHKPRPGLPQSELSKCASACAFILAAGARRLVGPTAFVGVHRIRTFRVMLAYRPAGSARVVAERWETERVVEIPTPQRTYDEIRKYFGEMGIGEQVVGLILQTPADSLHWMTRGELKTSRLATDGIDGMELVLGPTPAEAEEKTGVASGE
ncbi:MAG TPA: hypothetical protein VFZ16_11245 [Hyphomicrobiaceae bacterium]|nr:hypothetical protein [Hyphomicrobiaceae bacterium]